jgi:uncharacterized protein (TIGR03083 family)
MGKRGQTLADQFEKANREMIDTLERCSDAQWKTKTAGEKWSVGVVAHHVAQAHAAIAGLVEKVATGQPMPPLTADMLNQMNAEHAKQHANCTKDETVSLLRKNAATAASTVRGLPDEQFDRTASLLGGPPMTAQQVVERVLIGHLQEHHGNIRAAVGAK